LVGTWGEAPSSESVKNIATRVVMPKPRLHASLSPWTKTQFWCWHYYYFKRNVKEN
jgi:hypothetical protein